jgi:dihydrofolate reductase
VAGICVRDSDDYGAVVESYDISPDRTEDSMSKLKLNISMSLDGYVAGPEQSTENPLGIGGERLHDWVVSLKSWRERHGMEGGEVNASTPFAEDILGGAGATIMGRNMFGGGPGPWRVDPWEGWWGDDPPLPHAGLRADPPRA